MSPSKLVMGKLRGNLKFVFHTSRLPPSLTVHLLFHIIPHYCTSLPKMFPFECSPQNYNIRELSPFGN